LGNATCSADLAHLSVNEGMKRDKLEKEATWL